MSLSCHLPCIEALAATPHIGGMPFLLAALVTIRVYDYAAVPPAQMAAARAAAGRIFEDAGISVSWLECRVPGAPERAACTEPLLSLRKVVNQPPQQRESGISFLLHKVLQQTALSPPHHRVQ